VNPNLPPALRTRIQQLHSDYQKRFESDAKTTIADFNKTREDLSRRYAELHGVDVSAQQGAQAQIVELRKKREDLYAQITEQIDREVRLIAQQPLRYRRQILALKQYFAGTGATVILLDDRTSDQNDRQLASLAHGVVNLDQLSPLYGAERRRLRVSKLRGGKYRGGYHDFVIQKGGLGVFPRLVAGEHDHGQQRGLLQAGNRELDALLGGGLQYGTSAVLLGPAGSGKSTLALQYARAAAGRDVPELDLAMHLRFAPVAGR